MRQNGYNSGSHVNKKVPLCVNWHIIKECNYRCKYCFAKFKGIKNRLSLEDALKFPSTLKNLGCKKINIAGGEPLLYPNLKVILEEIYRNELTASIITNGSLLNKKRLEDLAPYLDWIGMSLDSPDERIQKSLGRGRGNHVKHIIKISELIHEFGIKMKINTVVTSLNKLENMAPIIEEINPDRWKVFMVLGIKGENDETISELNVSEKEFSDYCKRNYFILKNGTKPVFENNNDMIGSYWMIAPDGRFYDNVAGQLRYWKTDFSNLKRSLSFIPFDSCKFIQREGIYDW